MSTIKADRAFAFQGSIKGIWTENMKPHVFEIALETGQLPQGSFRGMPIRRGQDGGLFPDIGNTSEIGVFVPEEHGSVSMASRIFLADLEQ